MNGLPYHDLLSGGVLLGQSNRFEGVRKGLNKGLRGDPLDASDIVTGVLVVVGIGLAIWLLSYLFSWRERRRGRTSPLGLFLSLCKAHQLRWPQQWLLWKLARGQRLRDPARLFLEPQRFRPANTPDGLQSRLAELEDLRDRLFVETAPKEKKTEPAPSEASRSEAPPGGAPLSPIGSAPALDVPPWPPTPTTDMPAADSPQ